MTRCALLTFFAAAAPGFAQLVSYDGTAFPEETGDGWIRLDVLYPADRWLDSGWFVQNAHVLGGGPPVIGEWGFYRRELEDHAGLTTWQLTWVMATDGPQAFGAVSPASIVAGGNSGGFYHFTIAKDEVRLIRGSQFPMVFANIEEGMSHVYRLELRNTPPTGTYVFSIDGEVIDAGVAEGFYPTDDSRVTFGLAPPSRTA